MGRRSGFISLVLDSTLIATIPPKLGFKVHTYWRVHTLAACLHLFPQQMHGDLR